MRKHDSSITRAMLLALAWLGSRFLYAAPNAIHQTSCHIGQQICPARAGTLRITAVEGDLVLGETKQPMQSELTAATFTGRYC